MRLQLVFDPKSWCSFIEKENWISNHFGMWKQGRINYKKLELR